MTTLTREESSRSLTRETAVRPIETVARFDRVSHSFGNQPVLRSLNLDVRRGETLVVIGESGCGKSVTTKLLAGLIEPTSGEVSWGDRPIRHRSAKEMRRDRLKLGYLFQGAALFDSMNVYENVAFGLRENGSFSENDIREVVFDRLNEVGLAQTVAQKNPAELSGGMKKRVGLARALAMSPEIMIYDEPTTGLDPIMSGVIDDLIMQTQKSRRVTGIVVTHDMTTVRRVANRAIMLSPLAKLNSGEAQITFEGTRDELFDCEDPRVKQFVRGESGMFSTD